MLALNSYKNKLSLDGINDEGADDLLFFTTDSLFARKPFERVPNLSGGHNVIIGPKAGSKLKRSSYNVMLGTGAGFNTTNVDSTIKKFSSYNTFVGNNAGYSNVQGYYNTYIGYDSSKSAQNQISIDGSGNISHNIGIGVSNKSTGGRSTLVGNDSYNIGREGTVMGQQSSNSGRNSLIIGNKIKNSGSNAFILRANGSRLGPGNDGLINVLDNYFNINDVFEGVIGSNINVTSTITFNEPANFSNDIITENLQVNDQLVSLNESHINNGFVSRLDVRSNTILRDNVQILNTSSSNESVFDVYVETNLRGQVNVLDSATFNDNVDIKLDEHEYFIIRDNNKISDEILMKVTPRAIQFEQLTKFNEEVVFNSNVRFEDRTDFQRLASFSNTYTEIAHVDYMYLRNPSDGSYSNIFDFLNNSNINIQIENLIPWLDIDPSNIGLHIFNNDEFAPWIEKNQSDISLSGFGNDLAPWLDFHQSNIDLSLFNYDTILPRWVSENASKDNIAQVVQTRFGWLNEQQSRIPLNAFNNPWRWLRIDQKDVLLDRFNFEDKYKWLKLPNVVGNGQSNYNLNNFHNDLAPWLTSNASDINVFDFNTGWIDSVQRNVNLGDFYNDIAPWLNGKILQNMVPLSGFLQDEINLTGDLTIGNNLTVIGDVELRGQNMVVYSSNVNYLNDVSIHGSLNVMSNVFVYGPDIVFENNQTFRIFNGGENPAFSIDDQDLILNLNFTVNDNSSNPVLRIIDDQLWYKNENFDDLMRGLIVSIIETENNLQVNKPILFNEPAEFNSNVYFNHPVTNMSNVNMNDKLFFFPLEKETNLNRSYWTVFSEGRLNNYMEADLLFVSNNGSKITFHDHFEEGIFNFTGQHRCSTSFDFVTDDFMENCIGKIVVSTGKYMDIYNETTIRMNEAIPIVSLCIEEEDQCVFGVVSGFEKLNSDSREFKLGHLSFILDKNTRDKVSNKIMVNSVGEGGIWVCDVNGAFKNGDYITTSSVDGYGMCQNSGQQFNYTVGKITCDCVFDIDSELIKCEIFEYKGISYKKAFVGCIYCC